MFSRIGHIRGEILIPIVYGVIERLLNGLLARDPDVVEKLKSQTEGLLLVEHTGLKQAFPIYIQASAPQLRLLYRPRMSARAQIKGDAGGFYQALVSKGHHTQGIQISGDVEWVMALWQLMKGYEWDWEELLAQAAGDSVAHRVGEQVRAFTHWAEQTRDNLAITSREYLQEEWRGLPTAVELERFYQAVDTLRDDVARCSQHVALLQQHKADG